MASTRNYWRERVGSILAVVPLGVWTVIHLWNNLYGFAGADAWEEHVTTYSHPLSQALIFAIVLGPLVYHAIWGLRRIFIGRPNNMVQRNYPNLKFLLQRVSAVGVLLFIGAHLWLAMFQPRFTTGHAERFADISHEMHHHMPTLVVYLLGTLGVAYHLANGLETFLMKLGIRWPRKMSDSLETPFLVLFVVLLAMSWGAIYALYSAGA
jgi:succinate dehydrogenase / fumarate reductase cytochrome b subunit